MAPDIARTVRAITPQSRSCAAHGFRAVRARGLEADALDRGSALRLQPMVDRLGGQLADCCKHIQALFVVVLAAGVDLPPMAERDHEHQENLVMDLVHDAIVASADPPFALAADQNLGAGGTRLLSEKFYCGLETAPSLRVVLSQLTCSGRG